VPVTKYENGFIPRNTSLVPANKESIGRFAGATAELKKNCDSVTLYKNGKSSWLLATIGHEGMCILQDNTLLTSLVKAGYKASNEAPSWW
jgi:hypothetical protein